jgi:asparagine synthase (glutamine-hydrolysing)
MCGIAGYAGLHDPALLQQMCGAMAYRGPDDEGIWCDREEGIGLGHRRLSIIDISPAGHQPMLTDSGRTVIAYNGEVYNFQELRTQLEARGRRFRSHSDTEVILQLYEEEGIECLGQLNGMFALAIWDAASRRLLLARDHAGIKPLYYWQDGSRIYYASEIKALLKIPGIPRTLNHAAIADYLTFMWVPGDETMLAGIRKLEPGHYLTWENGRTLVRPWFSLSYAPDQGMKLQDAIDAVDSAMTAAVRRQMVSDVPLGAFLSGGLDSSSIVACMRNAFPHREITTYSARFPAGEIAEEQGADDHPYAEAVARHLGLKLVSVDISPDVVRLLPKMVYHLDEPDADPAIFPSYLISKQAREDGTTVLLSGTGGDEVFFGYRSHLAYQLYQNLGQIAPGISSALTTMATASADSLLGPTHTLSRRLHKFRRGLVAPPGLARHMALVDWSDPATRRLLIGNRTTPPGMDGFPDCMTRYSRSFQGRGHLNYHSHLLVQTFLASHNFLYTDKSSMAASLEVRVPFMDIELMKLAARLPEHFKLHRKTTKYVLKKAMEAHLPQDVIYRPKTGFGAPLRRWIREDLSGLTSSVLSEEEIRKRGIFNPQQITRILNENTARTADHAYLIYALLNLSIWMETFIDRPGVEVKL